MIRYFFRPRTYAAEVFLGISMVNFGPSVVKDDFQTRQIVRGTAIALGLRGYRQDKDKLPADLEELASWLGQAVPDDPIARAPFHYQPQKDPILFSSGMDLVAGNADDLVYLRKKDILPPPLQASLAKNSQVITADVPNSSKTLNSPGTKMLSPTSAPLAKQNPGKSAVKFLSDLLESINPPTSQVLEKALIEALAPAMNGGEINIEKTEIIGCEGRWTKVRIKTMGETHIEYFFFEKGKWQYANLIGGMDIEKAKQLKIPETLWPTPKEVSKINQEQEEGVTSTSLPSKPDTIITQNKPFSPSGDKPAAVSIAIFSDISQEANADLKKLLCPKQPDRIMVFDTLAKALATSSELLVLVLPGALRTPLSQQMIENLRERKVLGIGYGAASIFGSMGLLIENEACAHLDYDGAKEMVIDSDILCPGMKGQKIAILRAEIAEKSIYDHIAMHLHRKSHKAEAVQAIAWLTSKENYAAIVRQGNHLLIGIAAPPQDWTKDYRTFFRTLASTFAKQPNIPFTKHGRPVTQPGTHDFRLAPSDRVNELYFRDFSFQFSKPTRFSAVLNIRDSESVMLLFSGPNKQLWTRKDGQDGEELRIDIDITEKDLQQAGNELWSLRLCNFDKAHEAGCNLVTNY